MIGRILRLGLNDLRLTWKDRSSLVWMLVMPFVFVLFFGAVMSGRSQDPANVSIALTVVDQDASWLSRAIVEALQAEDFKIQEAFADDLATVEGRVRTLILPAGLADTLARGKQATLYLAPDPGANQQATAVAQIHLVRALTRILGHLVEMQARLQPGESLDLQVDRLRDMRALAQRPPLVRLESRFAGRGQPVPSGFGQAVPGMLTQFMAMITMISGAVYLTTDKLSGALRRLAVAPFTPRTLIAGRLTGLVMLALAQALILMIGGALLQRVGLLGAQFYWGRSPLGLALMIVAFAVATAGTTLFLGAILATPSQAGAVGWLAGMLMSGLGGCWWPLEVVPGWLRAAGHALPTAWMMDGMHELTSFGKGFEAVLPEALVLLAYGTVFALLGARFLRVSA